MRKTFTKTILSLLVCCWTVGLLTAQCINTSQYPSGTITPTLPGSTTISSCNYAGEYNVITLTAGYSFTFTSSVSTDFVTITDANNAPLQSGVQPLTYTPSATGTYRVHWSLNANCGTQNTCRVTSVNAFSSCLAATQYPSALQTPNNPGTKTISTCNYAGEYNRITLTAGYVYTFSSSIATDFVTVTDDANNVLAAGLQPFSYTPSVTAVYRVHWHTDSNCGTQSSCRTTTVGSVLAPLVVPFSGNNSVACGTNVTITDHGGASNYANFADGYTVFNASAATTINISGSYDVESGYDFIYIYAGSGTGGTLLGTYTGAGTLNYTGTPGQTLTLRFVADNIVTAPGFNLSVTYTGSCIEGDDVCSAIALTYGSNGPVSNVGTSAQTGEPVPPGTGCNTQTGWCSGDLAIQRSLWFTFVAPTSGHVTLQSKGYDTQLAIWDAADCASLLTGGVTLVAANDDDANYSAHGGNQFSSFIDKGCLIPGHIYFVQVDGYSGATGNLTVVLTDPGNAPPVVSACPTTININNTPGSCNGVATWTAPTFTDPEGGTVTVTSNYSSGDTFPVGTTIVTYGGIDCIGATATCSFFVIVTDNEAPVVTCPADVTVSAAAGQCSAIVNYSSATATDNCSTPTVTQTLGLQSGSLFPVGTTPVTFTATDASGNTSTCTFNVTVEDNEAPTLETCNGGTFTINISPAATYLDETTWTLTDGGGNVVGSGGPYGTSAVTATVVANTGGPFTFNIETQGTFNDNAADWSVSCSGSVIASGSLAGGNTNTQGGICCGTTPGCPANITATVTTGCTKVVTFATPTGFDNCSGAVTVTQIAGLPSGSAFPIGTTTNTFEATDAAGNTSTCSFDVIIYDTIQPVFNPIGCSGGTFTVTIAPGATFLDETTWTLTDANNNVVGSGGPYGTSSVSTTVVANTGGPFTFSIETQGTFNDNAAIWSISCSGSVVASGSLPGGTTASQGGICCGGSGCPADVIVNTDAGACGAVVTYTTPTATDNCSTPTVTQTSGLPSGSLFPVGTTTNTFEAQDSSGNTVLCSFTVTVTDNEVPVITCPADLAINADAGLCTASAVTLGTPITSDNCGVATVTNNAPSTFPVGATSVVWTVTDVNGNTATCTQTVTVLDAELPVINCPANITTCNPVVTFAATATDNCGVAGITYSTASGSTFAVGTTTVTVTATDVNGNVATCTFDVTVNATPVVSLGADVVQCGGSLTLDAGNAGATYAWSDNSSAQTLVVTSSGNYAVTVTNAAGCTATDDVDVTIHPAASVNLGPDVSQCAGGSVTLDAGNAGASFAWSTNDTTQSISVTTAATYSVTVTDANGCTATDDVAVIFETPPTVNLGADVVQCGGSVTLNAGNAGATYAWSNNATTQTINVTTSATYTVTVTNSSGCTGTDAVTVTINALPQVTFSLPADTFCTTDGNVTLTGGLPTGGTYSGNGVSNGVFSPSTGAGSYVITYSYTDGNGCSNTATDNIFVKVCVGISDIASGTIKLYPNPAADYVELSIDGMKGQLNVEIFDMLGQAVKAVKGNVETGNYKQVINVTDLASASYLVRVTVGNNKSTFNMIVGQK